MIFIEFVEDIFDIRGRGCVIIPGVPYSFEPKITKGSELEFHNPNGTEVRTSIRAFEMVNRGKPMKHAAFSIPKNIKKSDIEIGAKIYLLGNL